MHFRDIRVVTLDAYGTLVHFDGAESVYCEVLDGQASPATCRRFRQRYDEEMLASFAALRGATPGAVPFFTIRELYADILPA